MRAVIQRVSSARVRVDDEIVGEIETGLLVLVGLGREDQMSDAKSLASKIAGLRIFEHDDKMERSVQDVGGSVLVVSQFTLLGDARKGRRPSFASAMPPNEARPLFDALCQFARNEGLPVATGQFRAHMLVESVNDGPVTILLDTAKLF